jgi:hypothetical protein
MAMQPGPDGKPKFWRFVARDAAGVHASAARGIATPASALPHGDAIQRSFGRHDVSSVKAHAGPEAEASTREMGAEAYATGDHVVFGNATDLFTVAHEAAHVVQQRAGVHLKGGVGEAGDAYERQADAVAGLVVRGESAEALLGEPSPAGGAAQVQRSPASGANDREREDDDGLAEAAPPVQQRVSIDTRSGTRIVIVNERARDCGRRGTVLRRSRTRRDCLVVEFDNERHAGYRVYLDEMDYERSSHRDDDAPSRADGAPSSRGQVVSGSGSAGLWRPTGQSSAAWQNCADFAFQDPFLGAEQMVARIAAQAHTAGLKVTRSHSEATVVLYGRGETYTHAIRKVGSKWQEVQYPGGPHREYQGSEDPPLSNGSDVIVLMLRPV